MVKNSNLPYQVVLLVGKFKKFESMSMRGDPQILSKNSVFCSNNTT